MRTIKDIVDRGDVGDIRYTSSRRLNLGLFQKVTNVAWDLAPHDISIIDLSYRAHTNKVLGSFGIRRHSWIDGKGGAQKVR